MVGRSSVCVCQSAVFWPTGLLVVECWSGGESVISIRKSTTLMMILIMVMIFANQGPCGKDAARKASSMGRRTSAFLFPLKRVFWPTVEHVFPDKYNSYKPYTASKNYIICATLFNSSSFEDGVLSPLV